jgi:hypothetical protein
MVLDCYRLARFYHQSPDVFLNMALSEVETHARHTIRLTELMNRERARDDDGD